MIKQVILSFVFLVFALRAESVFAQEPSPEQPPEQSPELSTMIFDALKEGKTKIDIPKGIYSLELKQGKPMIFEKLKDVEINGNGSEVICRVPSQIMSVKNCENLTIKGFSFDSKILPFTQGIVVAADSEKGKWIEIEIHNGYEKENVVGERVQVFDPNTRRLKKNFWTIHSAKVEKTENGRWKMLFDGKNEKIEVGDLIVLGTKSKEPLWTHTVVIDDSKNCLFEDLTLYFSNCFAFLETGCHGNRYFRCKLIKKENDPDKQFPRLRSGNADSFHSKFATLGPCVEDCEFRDHGDDCIAINGNFYIVVESKDDKVLIFERHGHKLRIEPNDPVRFSNFDGKIVGDAKVLSVTRQKEFDKEKVFAAVMKYNLHGGGKELPPHCMIFELVLDKPLEVQPGGNVYAVNRIGSGFIARNNKIGFTRARGVLVKCSDGEISGNKIVGCELGAIIVAPELYWLEAGFSENLKIENNTIRDCFFSSVNWGDSQPAAISVVAMSGKGLPMEAGAMKNITIRNNSISGCPYPAMFLVSIDGGTVENNKIDPPKDTEERKHGQRFGELYKLDYAEPVWKINNENLKIEKP